MIAPFWYFILKIWGLASPVLGPVWSAFRNIVPFGNVTKFIMPTIALAATLFLGWHVWHIIQPDYKPQVVSIDTVRANRAAAEIKSLKEAVVEANAALTERDIEVEAQRQEYEALESELKEARNASTKDKDPNRADAPFIAADDPWMRK